MGFLCTYVYHVLSQTNKCSLNFAHIFVSLNDLTFKEDNEQKIEVSLQEGKFQRNVLLGRGMDAVSGTSLEQDCNISHEMSRVANNVKFILSFYRNVRLKNAQNVKHAKDMPEAVERRKTFILDIVSATSPIVLCMCNFIFKSFFIFYCWIAVN